MHQRRALPRFVSVNYNSFYSNIHQLPATSAFANTSSASPFASLEGSKSSRSETSKAAFEASSFSKLAQSSTSPFGTLGTSIVGGSSFGGLTSGKKLDSTEPEKAKAVLGSAFGSTAKSPFGSAGTALGFGGAPSAFAKIGGGTAPSLFGTTLAAASGPSSGSRPTIVGLNSKPSKPFGAPDTDDEDNGPESSAGDEDEEGDEGDDQQAKQTSALQEELKRDRRFHEHYGRDSTEQDRDDANKGYSGDGRGA